MRRFDEPGRRQGGGASAQDRERARTQPASAAQPDYPYGENQHQERSTLQAVRIYPYGVARNRLGQAARRLSVPAVIVNDPGEADALVTLRSYYRKRQRTISDAENRNVPIYVLRANTVNQMQQFLSDLFDIPSDLPVNGSLDPVVQETRAAIESVMNGERWVELPPAVAAVRRLQHQMARDANLLSHSYGKEPRRRVRIFRE
jgi:hypothetical protein